MTLMEEITRDSGRNALRVLARGRGMRARRRRELAVNLLVAGVRTVASQAPVGERHDLYASVNAELLPRQRDASLDVVLQQRLAGLFVLLERCLPAFADGNPSALHRGMMETAVALCEDICQGAAARNPYWRCIVGSLWAECLVLIYRGQPEQRLPERIRSRILTVVANSEAAYTDIPEPRDSATDRHLFNCGINGDVDFLEAGFVPVGAATPRYIQQLVDEVSTA